EWVHVQLHQQKGMISLSPPTICNSAFSLYSVFSSINPPKKGWLIKPVHHFLYISHQFLYPPWSAPFKHTD
ncbi:hypothetical protein, partial [Escherichia coli]|uniref:hypothetical protein n=1 Tax=Escherichia coli TaxID=562 RepID=UPI002916612B